MTKCVDTSVTTSVSSQLETLDRCIQPISISKKYQLTECLNWVNTDTLTYQSRSQTSLGMWRLTLPWWAEFLSHWPFMCIWSCGALHLALSCYLRSYNNCCATFFPCFRIDKLACVLLCVGVSCSVGASCAVLTGSFHVKSMQKILTLTDLNETWFRHSVCRGINPQWVSTFCDVWLQS